jgi:hypothetical protein
MAYNLFSGSNQIKKQQNYTTEMVFQRQEATPDVEDAMYILAERNNIADFINEYADASSCCYEYRFFFDVHIKNEYNTNIPENEDLHYNVVIKKVLDWYMNGEPSRQIIKELFEGKDVLRISINRHFSYDYTKHIFSITIVSLMNHNGDWGELKNQLANPNPNHILSIDDASCVSVYGKYPNNIPDSINIHKFSS